MSGVKGGLKEDKAMIHLLYLIEKLLRVWKEGLDVKKSIVNNESDHLCRRNYTILTYSK